MPISESNGMILDSNRDEDENSNFARTYGGGHQGKWRNRKELADSLASLGESHDLNSSKMLNDNRNKSSMIKSKFSDNMRSINVALLYQNH
ncbi:hypothetical protein CEXT_529971 [Caerostris extrusa]|uniref:Uncharacterized protein n=1 Tax=Caerostris extrusa TaxID=172846 RepID=A0AAV4V9C2_CAEEX|nr:hypothetical protein CEXT_529971 [Caerostris extrusa]